MVNDALSKMTPMRWILVAAIVAAVVIFSLFQFTSFQIPRSVTQGTAEPRVHQGIEPGGSTQSRTNLDRVYDQIHHGPGSGPGGAADGENTDE